MTIDLPEADIFDVDGTLADVEPFRYLVRDGRRDFDAFHRAGCKQALPNQRAVDLALESRDLGRTILVMSGRAWKWYTLTHE
jgi:hypothetical protein